MEYLNTMDVPYRSELERLNDVNWSRVESRIGQTEARVEARLAELKAALVKWMFLFWLGTIGTFIALQRL